MDSHIYWSTDPVEWSPIGEVSGDSTPATATELLKSKATQSEKFPSTTFSPVKIHLDTETRRTEKAANSRSNKLLPILVVILLLIGLIAALLSSFILPNSSHNGNTSKVHLVVEVRSIPASEGI